MATFTCIERSIYMETKDENGVFPTNNRPLPAKTKRACSSQLFHGVTKPQQRNPFLFTIYLIKISVLLNVVLT